MMIEINKEECIGCGLCARDCFPDALTMEDDHPVLTEPGNCLSCGHCIAVCPKNAVSDSDLDMSECHPCGPRPDFKTLINLMQSRRSCRHFTPDPVGECEIAKVIAAGRACPTAKNLQATRYIVVREKMDALLDMALEALGAVGVAQLKVATDPGEIRRAQNFITWAEARQTDSSFNPLFFGAPLLVMTVADESTGRDAAAAAAYMELMAAALGLGCLYSGYFTAAANGSPDIRRELGLRDGEQVIRCLVLGHPDVLFFRTVPRKSADITEL